MGLQGVLKLDFFLSNQINLIAMMISQTPLLRTTKSTEEEKWAIVSFRIVGI